MSNEKEKVALSSVVAAIFVTILKIVVGVLTGSLGIISEAAHSALDFGAAAITYVAVRISGKPADSDHQYGHGKVENFSALFETFLLMVTCVWIVYKAVGKLIHGEVSVDVNIWSFAVMFISIAVDVTRSRVLMKAARKYNSQALEADALHFSSDVLSSSVVIVGLIAVKLGYPIGDPIAALGVAVFVITATIRLGKRTIDALLDKAPMGTAEEIRQSAQAVDGVISCSLVRVRTSGSHTFVDMKLCLGRGLTLEQVNKVISTVEKRVQELLPGADVMLRPIPALGTDEIYEALNDPTLRPSALNDIHELTVEPHEDHYHGSFHVKAASGVNSRQALEMVDEVHGKLSTRINDLAELHVQVELSDGTELELQFRNKQP